MFASIIWKAPYNKGFIPNWGNFIMFMRRFYLRKCSVTKLFYINNKFVV